jgi:hypothetical protein
MIYFMVHVILVWINIGTVYLGFLAARLVAHLARHFFFNERTTCPKWGKVFFNLWCLHVWKSENLVNVCLEFANYEQSTWCANVLSFVTTPFTFDLLDFNSHTILNPQFIKSFLVLFWFNPICDSHFLKGYPMFVACPKGQRFHIHLGYSCGFNWEPICGWQFFS